MRDIAREIQTVNTMIFMYCKGNHVGSSPCDECQRLMEYAEHRIYNCPRGDEKGNCDSCPVHCYKPEMRERIRAAMRYAGPRMVLTHPIMAVRHMKTRIARR